MNILAAHTRRIVDGARENREVWVSLTSAWLVMWAAGVYGYQYLLPRVEQNAQQVAAVVSEVGELKRDVKGVQKDVTDVKVIQLEGLIFETRQNQCSASSQQSRQFFAQRLSEQLRTYEQMTSQQYRLPDCSELQ